MTSDPVSDHDIDRALARNDFPRALELLREASASSPSDIDILLKLAGVSRAAGRPREALDAVHRVLSVSPLHFTALLLRASLLQRLEHSGAGRAWGEALAQRPEGRLPAPLEAALAEAEMRHREWLATREQRLAAAMTDAEAGASEEELRRITRFRNNVLRRTRAFHSEPTHFFFPELAEREFHSRARFPWLADLEAGTETIAAELQALLAADRAELEPYIQYADHLPMRQWEPLNHNPDWSALHLVKNGQRVSTNADQCPRTMALLDHLPQPEVKGASPNAMFSLLAPQTHIPAHVGVSNARLVCHLPLIVPDGCWFRVGGETRHWRRGEAFVFDDTIEHEAMNPADRLRIVLIFDIWHPDLSPAECAAVAALIGAEGQGMSAGI